MNNSQNARSFSFVTWLTLQIIGNDIQLIRIMKPKYKDACIDGHIMKLYFRLRAGYHSEKYALFIERNS